MQRTAMWRTLLRGRAETVFGPLGLILVTIGALASAAFIAIAAFDPPAFEDLRAFSGTLTQQPQLRRAGRKSPWIELAVKETPELLAVQTPRFLDDDLVPEILSLTPGTSITAWVEPDLRGNYLVIWQLRGTSRPLQFADFVRAHRNESFNYLKFTGSFLAIGLAFLAIEFVVWRRRQRAARLHNA